MRRDYAWFEKRATTIWQAMPGRSFLLVVPFGSDEAATATAVARWTELNFPLPPFCRNHRPIVIRITSDGVTSSAHFVRKLCGDMSKQIKDEFDVELDSYPSEVLEEIHAKGVYPIVVIERFHTFARIADDDNQRPRVSGRAYRDEPASSVTDIGLTMVQPDELVHRSPRGDGASACSKRGGSPMNFLCKFLIWSCLRCLLATRVQAQETELVA